MSMIGQTKALASLSSTLLARKGHARPAMRPQGFGGFGSLPGAQDDLGWNDMGDAPEMTLAEAVPGPGAPPVPPVLVQREVLKEEFAAPVLAAPVLAAPVLAAPVLAAPVLAAPVLPVVVDARQDMVPAPEESGIASAAGEGMAADEETPLVAVKPPVTAAPAPAVPDRPSDLALPAPIARETAVKTGRVAFTLRIDADRHLRLRLASALENRSAQLLMTEALDAFLTNLPDVEALARQRQGTDPIGDVR